MVVINILSLVRSTKWSPSLSLNKARESAGEENTVKHDWTIGDELVRLRNPGKQESSENGVPRTLAVFYNDHPECLSSNFGIAKPLPVHTPLR